MTNAATATCVRPARSADAAALSALAAQFGYAANAEQMAARLQASRDGMCGEVLVAERNGNVCAWIAIAASTTLTHDRRAEVAGLVVDAALRGQRIGALLLAAAEQWARANGCVDLRLRSNVTRDAAHRFYDREGYARVKTQLLFEKALDTPAP